MLFLKTISISDLEQMILFVGKFVEMHVVHIRYIWLYAIFKGMSTDGRHETRYFMSLKSWESRAKASKQIIRSMEGRHL